MAFVIRFKEGRSGDEMHALARIDSITTDARGWSYIGWKQYMALLRLGTPHKLISTPEIFTVRFENQADSTKGMIAMSQVDSMHIKKNGDVVVNDEQLNELKRLKIPYKIVSTKQV
jgi:hypothetical protein